VLGDCRRPLENAAMPDLATQISPDQNRWCINAQQKYGESRDYYRELVIKQNGKCAFSGVELRFDVESGTALKDGRGCHALYAALDHTKPSSDDEGHSLVCYALNDIKGHLPYECFVALQTTDAWGDFMQKWRTLAERDANESRAFYNLRHQ